MSRALLLHPYPSVLIQAAVERTYPGMGLVVPNVQAGRELRGLLRAPAQASTLTQLAREALRSAGWQPITAGQREVFLREALGEVEWEYLGPLKDRPGTLAGLQKLFSELSRSNTEPVTLLRVATSARERDVAAGYAAFIARCRQERRFDASSAEAFASQLQGLRPVRVLMHGFAYLDASQLALAARLLEQGSVVTLPFESHGRGLAQVERTVRALEGLGFVAEQLAGPARRTGEQAARKYLSGGTGPRPHTVYLAPDIEAEVRVCLRQVRVWLNEGTRPERLAVIVRNEAAYIGVLADVAREYGLPLVSGQQVPLGQTSLGSLLQAWIGANLTSWRYSATRRLLTHPLLRLGHDPLTRARALTPHCPAGLAPWDEALSWLALPEVCSGHDAVSLIGRMLSELGVLARCKADPGLNVAMTLLVDGLREESKDHALRPREEILELIIQLLTTTTVPVMLSKSGVRVASPLAALGRNFDHVWVLGLADTLFPPRVSDNPLVDSEARSAWREAGLDLPDASGLASVEEALFLGAISGAGIDLVLSRPRRGPDGAELRESGFLKCMGVGGPLIEDALPLGSLSEQRLRQALSGESLPDPLAGKAALEGARDRGEVGPHQGQLSTPVLVDARRWSPSQLHDVGACHFRWFAKRLLGLQEPLDPDAGEDRRVTGTLLHAALEGALADWTPEDETSVLLDRAEAAFGAEERRLRRSGELRFQPLWAVDREELLATLRRLIGSAEFLPPGWRPEAQERRQEFTVNAGPYSYSMVGVVDRLDHTPDGRAVTDYKTGGYLSKVQRGGRLDLELQLPLYMEALGATSGRYLSIEKMEVIGEAGPSAEGPRRKYSWVTHQEDVTTFLTDLGSSLERGDLAPRPDNKREACEYCSVKPVCRYRDGAVSL